MPVPMAYLQGLRKICDETGILLILDEVQSGFARTGLGPPTNTTAWSPILSTWAKAMGGGMPIGAVIGKADVMDGAQPGTIGGTYTGTQSLVLPRWRRLSEIERLETLPASGRDWQAGSLSKFRELQTQYPNKIGDVRGIGAMVAMELVEDGDPNRPATKLVAETV